MAEQIEQQQQEAIPQCTDEQCPQPLIPQCVDGVCPTTEQVELPNGMICNGGMCQMPQPSENKMQKWIKWFIILIAIPVLAYLAYQYFIKQSTPTVSNP